MNRALGMLLCATIVSVVRHSASTADAAPPRLRELPPLLRAVSDEPGVLSVAQGRALSRQVSDVERKTGVEIIVVILSTTRPESIEAYVQRLIDHWRRASKQLDHGRFVFVAVAKEDREMRIVPSATLAWVLKPLTHSEVVVQAPALLKQDKYYEALAAITAMLSQLITDRGSVVFQEIRTWRRFDTTIAAIERPRYP